MRKHQGWMVAMLWLASAGVAMAQHPDTVDLSPYLERDRYEAIKISPDGRYLAATVPLDDRTGLVILSRADKRVVKSAIGVQYSAVADFWWVDDGRVVIAMAQALGSRDVLYRTGELHVISVDGAKVKRLIGESDTPGLVDYYGEGAPREFATMIDPLPADPDNVLISIAPLGNDPLTRVEKLGLELGRRTLVVTAPARRADFTVDAQCEVRFAVGSDSENYSSLYYRAGAGAEWRRINDERQSGRTVTALGLSADGATAYLRIQASGGPDAIESWDTRSDRRTPLVEGAKTDPYALIYDTDGRTLVGVKYMDSRVHSVFFDETSAMARTTRMLEKAFDGLAIDITSFTRDGSLALLRAWSDRTPGDYYLYDTRTRKADGVFVQREALSPAAMSTAREIAFPARDGVGLRGYLNLPMGKPGTSLPMVVMVHGGPFGIFDEWRFDTDTQMLAAAGYAVLRVNYRGSGNYGRAFLELGARQWGGTMQDDVTDATRWAIDQGIADPGRICIYGASYGGYAALMGVAKEPGLYRCAVGYVGVYDLVAMHRDDSRAARWLGNWVNDWVGERRSLADSSPVNLADRIKVPVFLAAGGADLRAPIGQTKKMASALRSADVPVQTLYYDTEGHGFTAEPHRREFYTRLLDFLSTSLGGAKAR